jgi:hypothetical protein
MKACLLYFIEPIKKGTDGMEEMIKRKLLKKYNKSSSEEL